MDWFLILAQRRGRASRGRVVSILYFVDLTPRAPLAITITGGDSVVNECQARKVPKRDLVSTVAVLLQTGRLRIARDLKDAPVLEHELRSFRAKISLSGNDTYEAWRERDHDDLVLAVALAAWLKEKGEDGILAYYRQIVEERCQP